MHLVHLKIDPENNLLAGELAAAEAQIGREYLAKAHAAPQYQARFDWDFTGAERNSSVRMNCSCDPRYSYCRC